MALTTFHMAVILRKHMWRHVPIDTHNLERNGINLQQFSPSQAGVVMGGPQAPYGPITNLPWISPKWGGKKNPNEGWANRAALATADEIAQLTGGRVE